MSMLAIKGHATRGKEVIALLEMLGGRKEKNFGGNELFCWYYINENGNIDYKHYSLFGDAIQYTLEEFLEKFPYKVGNKVNYVKYNDVDPNVYTIQRMQWTGATIEYLLDSNGFSALTKDLQPYKEETIKEEEENFGECIRKAAQECLFGKEETTEEIEIKIDIPKGYEFAGIDDNSQQVVFTKIQPEYPTTYKECCDIFHIETNRIIDYDHWLGYRDITQYDNNLLTQLRCLRKIRICRDAYWKLAGEQMGLDKPWEPDWEDSNATKYIILCFGGKIILSESHEYHHFLAFPTEEMRDAFKENFDSDIDVCKEFL